MKTIKFIIESKKSKENKKERDKDKFLDKSKDSRKNKGKDKEWNKKKEGKDKDKYKIISIKNHKKIWLVIQKMDLANNKMMQFGMKFSLKNKKNLLKK